MWTAQLWAGFLLANALPPPTILAECPSAKQKQYRGGDGNTCGLYREGSFGSVSADDTGYHLALVPRARGRSLSASRLRAFCSAPGLRTWVEPAGLTVHFGGPPSGGPGSRGQVGPGVPSWRVSLLSSGRVTQPQVGCRVPQDGACHGRVVLI